MDAVLLDTDVFSYLLRPSNPLGELYRKHVQGKTIAISFVTVGELYFGAKRKGYSAKTMAELEERLKAAVIVPYDLEICRTYANLRVSLKTPSGSDRSIGANDLWIASCAIRHNLKLITNNRKHFEGIPELQIITEATQTRQAILKSGKLFETPPESSPH